MPYGRMHGDAAPRGRLGTPTVGGAATRCDACSAGEAVGGGTTAAPLSARSLACPCGETAGSSWLMAAGSGNLARGRGAAAPTCESGPNDDKGSAGSAQCLGDSPSIGMPSNSRMMCLAGDVECVPHVWASTAGGADSTFTRTRPCFSNPCRASASSRSSRRTPESQSPWFLATRTSNLICCDCNSL